MTDTSTKSFTLEREQEVNFSGKLFKVLRTELTKPDLVSFELIAEVSFDAAFINALFDNPLMLKGCKVQCVYEGEEVTAELSAFVREENLLARDKHILHFVCSTVENTRAFGDLFRFLLPHVDFGVADHTTIVEHPSGGFSSSRDLIRFVLDGREWSLRHLIEFNGSMFTAAEAIVKQREAGVVSLNLRPSGHAALEVSSKGLDQAAAREIAGDICWLLHLALAQRVAWSELHIVSGAAAIFGCKRAASFPTKPSRSKPISNSADGALQSYFEQGWPVFQSNASWWRVTLNWFSIAAENAALESSSMIYCMLFDRISTHLLEGFKFPKQISEKLTDSLNDKTRREELIRRVGELLGEFTDNWDEHRSKSLVEEIENRNNRPSYPRKVAEAYARVALKPPPAKMLQRRHTLMHDGGLKIEGEEAVEFLCDLHQSILVLILSMFNYNGVFYSLGRGEQPISTFKLPEVDAPEST